jgi:hypothetical protein
MRDTDRLTEPEPDADALATLVKNVVAWEWDASTDRVLASDRLADVYGVDGITGIASGMDLVHPGDREAHDAIVHMAVERGRGYASSFRIVRPDTRAVRWIDERAEAIQRGGGEPAQLIGLAYDATIHHQSGGPRALVDTLVALQGFGDVLLAGNAKARQRLPPSERTVRGEWVTTATREFEALAAIVLAAPAARVNAIRAATAALRRRLSG